jgi:hypothetical protein
MIEINRQNYINGSVTFQQYYGKVIELMQIKFDKSHPLVQKCLNSTDPHYNDTGLQIWDSYAPIYERNLRRVLKSLGDQWSLAGNVCMLKEAVRLAINNP